MTYSKFKKTVWAFYAAHGRHSLPWRRTRDPYKILVSEVMLQQTQVERVVPKYKSFLKKFPTTSSLSAASVRTVLREWQGLGYNRRAINLKRAAEIITKEYKGVFPQTIEELVKLPGVGRATAGDVVAFAWNKPATVIETNIRTVFIHHFFEDKQSVRDKEIATLIEKTLDIKNPRQWYYALMDYGAYLKQTIGNPNKKSAHYKKQPAFKGSNRELRSHILKLVLSKPRTKKEIVKLLSSPAPAINKNIIALEREGLIRVEKGTIRA